MSSLFPLESSSYTYPPFVYQDITSSKKLFNSITYSSSHIQSDFFSSSEMSTTTRNTKRKVSEPTKKVVLPVKKVVTKVLPSIEIEGKFIKVTSRTVYKGDKTYTFSDGMLVVDEVQFNKLKEWGNTLGFTSDYNPYFHSEKEYKGEVQHSDIVTFGIRGENVSNENEFIFLSELADAKADVKCKLGGECSTFQNKDGDSKSKFQLSLVYDSMKQVVWQSHECDIVATDSWHDETGVCEVCDSRTESPWIQYHHIVY